MVFSSVHSRVVPHDTNGAGDIFVVDRGYDPDQPAARFAVWDLRVEPAGTLPLGPVTVSARVTNVGDAAGEYDAVLQIGGAVADTRTTKLRPGESARFSWTVSRDQAGTYPVRVGHATGAFTVGGCAEPDPRATVVIGDVDSGVPNRAVGADCTINDLIDEGAGWLNHGEFVRHVPGGRRLAAGRAGDRPAGVDRDRARRCPK